MEGASEGENNRNNNSDSPIDGPRRPKRQMKTPYQLRILEDTYALEAYPSEATRAELSEQLGLSDRQLQMWFCHRRLKDKKDGVPKKPRGSGNGSGKRGSFDSGRDELVAAERVSDHGSGSGSGSRSETGSSQSDDGVTAVRRYHQSPSSALVRIAVACVQEQLGEPLRQDGPILGMEFDELPPGAFGQTIGVRTKQEDRSWYTCEGKSFEQPYFAPAKAAMRDIQDCLPDEPRIRSDAHGRHTTSNFYDSPAEFSSANLSSHSHGIGRRRPRVQGPGSVNLSSQPGRQGPLSSSSGDDPCAAQRESLTKIQMDAQARVLPVTGSRNPDVSEREIPNSEYGLPVEKKRKSSEARIGKQVESQEKRIRKELEKQDMLRRKREEQMRREMEKQERERRKDEARMMREKQRQQEKFLREERREIERREKFLQKESQKAERRRQKEELRREKEEAKLRAALEKATARKLAKESVELIEDERLELMELAALSKGFPSIVALDYDTLQNIESFRGLLRSFPPKSVQLKRPFSIQPWTDSDENIGNLLMVWRFCITFADILELWPFTLDEFVQAIHDYDSRLLSEIHIALLKLIIKDIEDVARTPSTGMGTNQYGSANPEGGHPRIVEGAYMWGFDIRNWKKFLNPMTWPEVLRQFALSAGFGPQLKKRSTERCLPDNDETKGCEDIVSILRNGSAAENAFAIMQEKGFSLQRRSRHRLTPGTVKFAAYHVLSLEGSKGLTVLELAHKIQKSGLRDLTTSKTPEASISVALSRDPVLFERTAPSTYRVRPPFRKDPADAEAILSAAREKIKRYETGFLAGENADDVERDEDSEGEGAEGPEVDDVGTPNVNKNSSSYQDVNTCSGNEKENFSDNVVFNLENESDIAGTHVDRFISAAGNNNDSCNLGHGDTEIDESKSGEPWVQGLTEGEYSELSVEERLSALVALVGIANEGICTRAVLEDRLDAATALKKQMWAEVQLHKKRCKEENISRFHCSSFMGNEAEIKQTSATAESSQSPLATVDSKLNESPLNTAVKKESLVGTDNAQEDLNSLPLERSMVESDAAMVHIGSIIQQNGCAAERLHLQLKSYVGHRAEEMYVYRSLPLGQDRRRNRYWQFVASASKHDPGSGRIFFESPDGYWMLIDTEEGFDALLASLDTRGIRESHLSIMLQNIEKPFKENVRKNSRCVGVMEKDGSVGNGAAEMDSTPQCSSDDSPSSTLYGSYSNIGEPSSSFRIELGKNETDKKAAVGRYQEFQTWMWKECFNSSILCAMRYGRKRCRPLLGICQFCLNVYIVGNNLCPSCYREFGNSDDNRDVSENIVHCQEKRKVTLKNSDISDFSLPLRIRLLKAFLTVIEVTVPSEALQSSWTENYRNSWGMKLHCSTSAHSLLQILTEFEAVLRRDCLSTNFETTEELLGSSAISGRDACDSADPRSVPHLPWIPKTSSAVAFRLLELDASTFYLAQQRSELHNSKEVEDFTPPTRYTVMKTVKKAELLQVNQDKAMKVKNSRKLASVHGASRHRQGVRGRTPGRPQKRVVGSSTRDLRDDLPLNQVLWQQGRRTQGQRPGWGRRTIRRRRTEERVVQEPMLSPLGHVDSPKDARQSPREFAGEEWVNNADSSDNLEAVDSDDDGCAVGYKFGKQGTGNSITMSDEDEDGTDDDNDGSKEVGEENVDANEDTSSEDSDGNENESTDSGNSEDYSE
ncbi:homeobox-DDT domain protein RLT1-like isoform X2 [Diospyros lotus]|uniref:homeobox-DDT domain protein RLT1-like isoform X2 n=1 Tax=Diospyros lotus TaxID=55363 RepID=UPI0022540DDC|nr:homeobox-DDT domain protein RLT1-like isoform X2 [Diospyros lotus]